MITTEQPGEDWNNVIFSTQLLSANQSASWHSCSFLYTVKMNIEIAMHDLGLSIWDFHTLLPTKQVQFMQILHWLIYFLHNCRTFYMCVFLILMSLLLVYSSVPYWGILKI